MPRIQEYLPEEQAAGPQAAAAPDMERVTAAGRGIETFGRDMGDASKFLYDRQSQMDSANAASTVAEDKVDRLTAQQKAMDDGTYDNDKFKQDYQQWQSDQSDKFDTAAGKNTFMRASSRTLGSLLNRGNRIQTTIAYNNAASSYQDTVDSLATASRLAPDTLQDNLDAATEHAHDTSENHSLDPKDREALLQHAHQTIVAEAIKGTAQTDPAAAMAMLQNKDIASKLKPKDMDSLYGIVKQAQNYQDQDGARQEALQKKASAAVMNKYLTDNVQQAVSGKITPQQVMINAPAGVDFETRVAFAKKVSEMQGLVQKTSPATMLDMMTRLTLPKDDPRAIVDVSQLIKQPGLSLQNANNLQKWYFKQPQGAAEKQNEKLMQDDIKGKLKVQGLPDQDYNNRVINALSDYQKAKQTLLSQGKDPSGLTDPKSPDYFPKTVRATSATEIMQAQAQAMIAQATGKAPPSNDIVHTSPGIIPNQQTTPLAPGQAPAQEEKRKLKNGKVGIFDGKTKQFLRYEGT